MTQKSTIPIFEYNTIDSTNSEARRLLNAGKSTPPFAVLARHQTNGRGRHGRQFLSFGSASIYLSLVLNNVLGETLKLATIATAVGVRRCLANFAETPKIKWVNDIFIEDKKICGILTETHNTSQSSQITELIIGVGINANVQNEEAVSLDLGKKVSGILIEAEQRLSLSNLLVSEVFYCIEALKDGQDSVCQLVDEYKQHSLILGKTISYTRNDTQYCGTAEDICYDGSLLVNQDGEYVRLNSGEVHILGWE
jgi:BirA family biotin operon repressor/biotin-[acetyl-CoA-carboxylase] ligase